MMYSVLTVINRRIKMNDKELTDNEKLMVLVLSGKMTIQQAEEIAKTIKE